MIGLGRRGKEGKRGGSVKNSSIFVGSAFNALRFLWPRSERNEYEDWSNLYFEPLPADALARFQNAFEQERRAEQSEQFRALNKKSNIW